MVRYVMLFKFTEQGITNVKDSPARAEAFKATASRAGATVESQVWTLGEYDGVVVFTAPDEATAVALALELGRLGNVRTCMLRAFDASEVKAIIGKMP
jgi:uncharacterized protein with GYD domain